ncbi:MAG: hypothetical protein ABSG64_13010 [Solirubrobacteraceae bacterium]
MASFVFRTVLFMMRIIGLICLALTFSALMLGRFGDLALFLFAGVVLWVAGSWWYARLYGHWPSFVSARLLDRRDVPEILTDRDGDGVYLSAAITVPGPLAVYAARLLEVSWREVQVESVLMYPDRHRQGWSRVSGVSWRLRSLLPPRWSAQKFIYCARRP